MTQQARGGPSAEAPRRRGSRARTDGTRETREIQKHGPESGLFSFAVLYKAVRAMATSRT